MELTDGTLLLRPPTDGDAEAICVACQDPEIPRWVVVVPQPYTLDDARGFVAWSRERVEAGDQSFVIVDATNGELLGAIAVTISSARSTGHIGYWVAAPARRRGVASGALRLLSAWGLGERGLDRLELVTDPDNIGSQRVAEKVGFRREGVLRSHMPHRDGDRRDSIMFSLLPGELA